MAHRYKRGIFCKNFVNFFNQICYSQSNDFIDKMPEICRFFHIIIRMYAKEHAPPHFHAFYGDYEAVFSISGGKVMEGKIPKKQERLIVAWAAIYKKELLANWESLTSGKGFNKIDPLI